MVRQLLTSIATLAAGAVLACSLGYCQDTSNLRPPPYPGVLVRMQGVFVTPVPGVPLKAAVHLESKQRLPDGTTEVRKTINNIARDLQGRIYNERRTWMNPAASGAPLLLSVHIYDPITKLNTFLDPATRIARQTAQPTGGRNPEVVVTPEDAKSGARAGGQATRVTEEDLGREYMENVSVHGTRTSRTIPAERSGTGRPVVVTDEYWYSEELHLNMLVKHADPRTGEQTVTVMQVERDEPSATMFEIPAGYKVVDETPEK